MDHRTIRAHLEATRSTGGTGAPEFVLAARVDLRNARLAIGRSRDGNATMLLMNSSERLPRAQRTEGLHVYNVASALVDFGTPETVEDTVVVECLSPALEGEFAVLISTMAVVLAESDRPTHDMLRELTSWRALFSRVPAPCPKVEQGLWGELWVLSKSVELDGMLLGWRGPEGGPADFFAEQAVLEVKTCSSPGSVQVSQNQANMAPRRGWLLQVPLEEDPSGSTCGELAGKVISRAIDPAVFLRALKTSDVACIRSPSPRRYSVLAQPTLHPLELLPRVRSADAGVHGIRYRVELDAETALRGPPLLAVLARFGLDGIHD